MNILQNTPTTKTNVMNPKSCHDFSTEVPQEIIIEILSRLPIQSIKRCKRVCKSWRNLVKLPEFATSHLSKSASTSCLAVIHQDWFSSKAQYKVCAVLPSQHGIFSCLTFLDGIGNAAPPHSSVNGLLFFLLLDRDRIPSIYLCNPITGEYTERPGPHPRSCPHPHAHPLGTLSDKRIYGFGVSKLTLQYKIVEFSTKFEGFVYTLGTGLWRSIGACNTRTRFECREDEAGVFLNGNLHWVVYDTSENINPWMCCLDLENEVFNSFSFLPRVVGRDISLCALEGGLCLCHNSPIGVSIWFMNKYGDENSWSLWFALWNCYPVGVFKDGDILLVDTWSRRQLFCYSNKNKTIRKYNLVIGSDSYCAKVVNYTPSFVSLKSLAMGGVASF